MSTAPDPLPSSVEGLPANPVVIPTDRNAEILPITASQPTMTTAHYLARRLHLVFHDLGLLEHIPSDWLQPSPEGLSFRSLSVSEADKFVLAVEDVAYGYKGQGPSACPNQPPLF
jgi:hypothetical protein